MSEPPKAAGGGRRVSAAARARASGAGTRPPRASGDVRVDARVGGGGGGTRQAGECLLGVLTHFNKCKNDS